MDMECFRRGRENGNVEGCQRKMKCKWRGLKEEEELEMKRVGKCVRKGLTMSSNLFPGGNVTWKGLEEEKAAERVKVGRGRGSVIGEGCKRK